MHQEGEITIALYFVWPEFCADFYVILAFVDIIRKFIWSSGWLLTSPCQ